MKYITVVDENGDQHVVAHWVFSEDGGSREDCSIFYARSIFVEQSGIPTLKKLLKYKDGDPDWQDDEVDSLVMNESKLVKTLREAGVYAVSVPAPEFVINEYGY